MILLTDATFDSTISACARPAIVLFETEWSGHCQIMRMIVTRLEESFGDSATFFAIDKEANPETSHKYKIGRVPTIVVFDRGQVIDNIVGITSEAELLSRSRNWTSDTGRTTKDRYTWFGNKYEHLKKDKK